MEKPRCRWCNVRNAVYVRYHDEEWGVPKHDDQALFELLVLEPFQAGLSWECVLNKREGFRSAFDGFDAVAISRYDEGKIAALMADASIIRNRKKIEAAIANAQAYLRIAEEWGSFDAYIWHFTDGQVIREVGPTRSPLSDAVARDMKQHGMRFIGATTAYAYLQAAGVINAHETTCYIADREARARG